MHRSLLTGHPSNEQLIEDLRQIALFIENNSGNNMPKELTADDWVSVEERLPKVTENVNVWIPENNRVITAYKINEHFERYSIMQGKWVRPHGKITHWKPLPQPPKTK